MFSIAAIWKRGFGQRLTMFALSLIVLLLPSIAAASGENYAWSDDQHTAITASGGSYASTATFAKSGTSYVATSPIYTCKDGTDSTASGTATITASGSKYSLDSSKTTVPATCTIDPLDTTITVASAGTASSPANQSGECDQGSVTWIMCPLLSNLASTISTIAKDALQPFLEISPLKSGTNSALYQAWSHIRDFADVLFIVIFLLIIFSTTIESGFDQYTIRKMLPRLVTAVILVQFSYFLVGLVIDTGNVLGAGVNDLLVSVVHPSDGDGSITNIFANIGEMATGLAFASGAFVAFASGFWVAALPILLGILISIAVVLVTFGMRFIILALLVILSPLAMVAWVLPNTEKYFHKWMSALLRLVMMYPIIMAILSVAGHISQLLPFSADTLSTNTAASILVAIMKPLIIIAAFALIPFTFRWAGAAVGNSHRFIQGLAGRAGGSLKSSGMAADGRRQRQMNRTESLLRKQNRAMMLRDPNKAQQVMAGSSAIRRNTTDRFATSAAGKSIARRTQGARMWSRGIAMGTTTSTGLALQRSYNSQFKDNVKALGDLEDSEATIPNLQTAVKAMYGANRDERRENQAKLGETAPTLKNYTQTVQGRAAIIRKLAEKGSIDDDLTRRMMEDSRGLYEYNQFIGNKAATPNPKEKPTITFTRTFDGSQPQNTLVLPLAANKIKGMGAHSLGADYDAANYTAGTGRVVGKDDSKNFEIFQRDELSKKLAQDFLDNVSYSAFGATFDPTNRNFADGAKRAAAVRMLQANEDLAVSGNAKEVREAALNRVIAKETWDLSTGRMVNPQNTDIFDALIEQAVRSDGFKGSLAGFGDNDSIVAQAKSWGNDESGIDQKRAFLRSWLNI